MVTTESNIPNSIKKKSCISSLNQFLSYEGYDSHNIPESVIPISISRVNQFDAARLDIEMSAMLKEQLVKVFLMKECCFNMKPNLMPSSSFLYGGSRFGRCYCCFFLFLTHHFLRLFSKDKSSSSADDDSACPICQASPTVPFFALPCQHRYCYCCLRTRCAAVPSFRCSRCNEPVVAMQRHTNNPNQKQ